MVYLQLSEPTSQEVELSWCDPGCSLIAWFDETSPSVVPRHRLHGMGVSRGPRTTISNLVKDALAHPGNVGKKVCCALSYVNEVSLLLL